MIKRFVLIACGVIVAVLVIRLAYSLLSPTNNGKHAVEKFIAASTNKCNWAGYVDLFKTHSKEIYVECFPGPNFPKPIDTKEQLKKAAEENLVNPWIEFLPGDPMITFVVIFRFSDNQVLCMKIEQNKIVSSLIDSYENYCEPP